MADTYFVRFRGRTVGPYSLSQAQQMARKGQLARTSEVSSDGQAWNQAAFFPELFEPASSSLSLGTEHTTALPDTFPAIDIGTISLAEQWHYTCGDAQKGPASSSEIMAMIKAGTLSPDDRVWREGLENWISLSDVPEFSRALRPSLSHAGAGSGVGVDREAFCRECGAPINRKAVICPKCGVPQLPGVDILSGLTTKPGQGNSLIAAGYVCAVISLLLFPPLFALIAFIIGIINLTRSQIGHGIAQIVLSLICGTLGMAIGTAMFG